MSDRPIQKGDLVMVVRGMPCCGHLTGAEGGVFSVSGIEYFPDEFCVFCGASLPAPTVFGFHGHKGIDLIRLLLIDPPPVAEDVPAEKELEHG